MSILIGNVEFRPFGIGDYEYLIGANGEAYSPEYVDRRGFKRGRKKLTPQKNRSGYLRYYIIVNKKSVGFSAHRLVANAFIPNPNNKEQVNHKNGIKTDNRVENLEWVTRSENAIHSFAYKLQNNKGENHPNNKLTNDDISAIRNIYSKGNVSKFLLSKIYGVSDVQIHNIVTNKAWQHI